eukprot:7095866-Prymnesium_polylepis.1
MGASRVGAGRRVHVRLHQRPRLKPCDLTRSAAVSDELTGQWGSWAGQWGSWAAHLSSVRVRKMRRNV